MSAPAGSDDEPDPETVFAALPPPDAFQKDAGWSRDWSRVWAPHEEKLAATRHLQGEALMDAFRSRPDHVSPNGTGRVLFFDVTGGPVVRLAKERARCEQIACETKAARVARDVAEQERKRREDVPDVVRVANMPTAVLQNGDTVPLLGLGTWKSTEPGEARRSVEHALKVGYTHIDCASVYENEKEVGDGMNHVFRTTRLNRKDVFVTSKLWNDKHHPNEVEAECRATLSDLRCDYLDLYLMHWPVVTGNTGDVVDPSLERTWKAMERLVDLGLVRSLGVSNFSVPKLRKIVAVQRIPLSVCQVECHPFLRQDEIREFCVENAIHLTAYSPLGSPDSASMFRGRDKVPELMKDPAVLKVSKQTNKNVGQVLLKWALQSRPGSSVLAKSANPDRLKGNLAVLDGWELDEQAMQEINDVNTKARMVDGSFWLHKDGPYRTLTELWDDKHKYRSARDEYRMRAVTLVRPKAVVRPDVTRRNTRRRVAVVMRASASSNENPSADAVATAKTWPTWGCEPSVFPWSYGAGEICLVIEGEATVVMDDGTVVLLKPGTIATFPKGSSCTWEVKAAIKKHYSFGP